jgi:hypothetical protein
MPEVTAKRDPEVGGPWFTNLESRWQRMAVASQAEDETVRRVLASYRELSTDLQAREVGDRIERCYRLTWKNPMPGKDAPISIYGRSRPMTESELMEAVRGQIEQAIAEREQKTQL